RSCWKTGGQSPESGNRPEAADGEIDRAERAHAHRVQPTHGYEGQGHTSEHEHRDCPLWKIEGKYVEGNDVPDRWKADEAVVVGFVVLVDEMIERRQEDQACEHASPEALEIAAELQHQRRYKDVRDVVHDLVEFVAGEPWEP